MFQGYMTTNYADILTSSLDKHVDTSIENGLSDPWLAMATWKGIDLNDVEFGNNKVSFAQFRAALKKHEGDRDGLMKEEVFKSHQTVLKLTADVVIKHISLQSNSKSYSDNIDDLSDEELFNAYRICHIRNEGREVDLICILPARKAILHIEVKDGESGSTRNINRNFKYAGVQLSAMKQWITDVHGDIFQGWSYVSVAALPSVPASQLPPHDPHFVISKDTVDAGLDAWFADLVQHCGIAASKPVDVQDYENYVEFTKRVIGFSAIDDDMRLTRLQVRNRKLPKNMLMTKGISNLLYTVTPEYG